MKGIIFSVVIAALLANTAFAAEVEQETILDSKLQAHEYTASVQCVAKKEILFTGWKVVKIGDSCFKEESKLIEIRKMESMGVEIELPKIDVRRERVTCP